MSEFKKGDVVVLKSGGPRMTIKNENSNGEAICSWFDGSTKREDYFSLETLVKPKPRSSSGVTAGLF